MSSRVYREDGDGRLVPVPTADTEQHPSAGLVVEALRSFLEQAQADDRILLRPEQARVLVELAEDAAQQLRRLADRLAPQQDKPAAVQDAAQPPAGRARGCFS